MTSEEAKTVLDAMAFINMPMSNEHYWLHANALAIMRKELAARDAGELCPACAASEFERVSGFGELK